MSEQFKKKSENTVATINSSLIMQHGKMVDAYKTNHIKLINMPAVRGRASECWVETRIKTGRRHPLGFRASHLNGLFYPQG
jgi:hypothetical protein